MKGIVIFGSSRSDGNTGKIVEKITEIDSSLDLIDLNEKDISYYDYSHSNKNDDFLPTVEKILDYDLILFVTPVYWYSMSAVMKTFFDRISDLLTIRKDLGRKLRGMSMGSLSCGSPGKLNDAFYYPFRSTAGYLGMSYTGHIHTWIENGAVSDEVSHNLKNYLKKATN